MLAGLAAAAALSPAVPKDYAPLLLTPFPGRPGGSAATGTVMVNLTVDPKGGATGCNVVQSSGTPDLDAATCAHIGDLLVFQPARGEDGRPAWGGFELGWRWQAGRPAAQPTRPDDLTVTVRQMPVGADVVQVGANVAVDEGGAVQACAPVTAQASGRGADRNAALLRPFEAAACGQIRATWRPAAIKDGAGRPVRSVQHVLVRYEKGEPSS